MTKKEIDRLEELEKKIDELLARPVVYPYIPVTTYYPYHPYEYLYPWITTTSYDGTGSSYPRSD